MTLRQVLWTILLLSLVGCQAASKVANVTPRSDRPTPPVTAPTDVTLTNPTLYVGNFDGNLYAIDTTGQVRWKFRADTSIQSSPVVAYGRVYVGSNRDHIYAVDAVSGVVRWSYQTN